MTKYLVKITKIKQNWTRPESFDISFCVRLNVPWTTRKDTWTHPFTEVPYVFQVRNYARINKAQTLINQRNQIYHFFFE